MKRILFISIFLCLCLTGFSIFIIDSELAAEMQRMDDSKIIKVNIVLLEQSRPLISTTKSLTSR